MVSHDHNHMEDFEWMGATICVIIDPEHDRAKCLLLKNMAGATHSPSEQGVKGYFAHYTQTTHSESVNYNV